MGELFAFQPATIRPALTLRASSRERSLPNQLYVASINYANESSLGSRSEHRVLSRNICYQWRRLKISARVNSPGVFSDSTVESGGEDIEIQPDGSGGDGFSSGGGGDNNNDGGNHDHGEGGSEESDDRSSEDIKKLALSMSQILTLGYAALVGVGGVLGYLKSGSKKSLMAGGLSAVLLYFVYAQLPSRPTFASTIGLGLSVALLGVMGSRFKKSRKMFPAGVVSVVSLIMSGGYLHGVFRSLH